MGEVYRARDTRLGRDVAVKVLPQHLSQSPEDRARFKREAKLISGLDHPHICVLHDVGREGDIDYIVMELLEGETLAYRLSRGALPAAEVLRIGAQIADALALAHRTGVIHRDLKPGNVMLTKAGAKLMDFGLARAARPSTRETDLTATALGHPSEEAITARNVVVGTVEYMAPEQLEGKDADSRSDIWALGCVLYEMTTGKRAFEGSTHLSVMSAIMRDQPRGMAHLAPSTPPALDRAVRQCLEKDPDERWQSSGDLRKELLWISEPGSQSGVAGPETVRHPDVTRFGWLTAGVLGLAMVAVVLSWLGSRHAPPHFSFVPLTYKPLTIFKAAFAPDGKAVVLSAATEGNTPRVYVIRPEYPEPQPTSELGTHLLSVSSKGELAVLTGAQYGIFPFFTGTLARMPLGGGAPREILPGVLDADWSPDGSQLAVIRGIFGGTLEYPIGHVLYHAGPGYLTNVRFSPKGNRIAFFEHPPGAWNPGGSLKVVDLQGRSTLVLTGYSGLAGIAWGPDGREIYFSGSRGGEEEVVYAAGLDGKTRVALQSAGGPTIHDVNREGQWLMTRDDFRSSVMVHKPEWKEDRDLSWLDGSQDGLISRDASFLVFTEDGEAVHSNSTICLRKTDGSAVTRIADGTAVALSPDGTRVLAKDDASTELVIQPTGVGEAKVLPRGIIESYNHALWFPNGDSILIRGNEHGKALRLYVQDLVGGFPRAVAKEGLFQGLIACDGSWVMAKAGVAGCFRYRFDGSPPDSVPWLGPRDQLLPWHVDDQSVLAIAGPWRNVPLHIDKIDLATGRRSRFLDISPKNRTGLLECNLSSFSADFRSYSYDATWVLSSLFLVQPAKLGG
jgi:sugar lactone lactonase YvrE